MSQYGYGAKVANPYDQRGGQSQPYQQPAYGGAQSPKYGGQQYGAPAMGRDDYADQNVEMTPLAQNGQQFGRQADPNAILNACIEVNRGMQDIQQAMQLLSRDHASAIDNPGVETSRKLENANSQIVAMFRELTGKVKSIKMKPDSGTPRNSAQVGKVDRELKELRASYLVLDASFNKKVKEQAMRQYRIVRPDATEAEVQAAAEQDGQQMFAQAMMQSNRRGQAQSVLSEVKSRNEAIKKIESQMIELAEMFQDMDNLVVQQEAAVVNIEQKGEEVVDNMDKGNEQIGTAIVSARNTRKWKWWCLGICVLIIIVIVVVILIYKFVIQNNNTGGANKTAATAKRFILSETIPLEKLRTSADRVIAGQPWSNDAVLSGKPYTPSDAVIPTLKKFRRFAA
ncbi:related to putative snare protein syn [Rhynchosporium graminicola]|uniref:Related to putative snare protein syn n=1 Tax=Rhynchosporium graminicola TaxID=2792576 RepID=A0A1E1LGA7_9HELO|nr:related to putative snare protein syn [Rhynchosporium commune]